ncbi:SUMF1/EgtB/PvdO family nonheme iron enzyme [Nitrospira sp. BLG_2]|uniref:SUMF1/EgtB/PvdO family nonheme iron enzyme n=1 Tax=Nitrospira sp. BLG_2 TaxID=3397507 RepID=UPI003B9962C0
MPVSCHSPYAERWWGFSRVSRCIALFMLLVLVSSSPLQAESNEHDALKTGVVQITARVDGRERIGTGIIVALRNDAAYIVTASHVVEGDPQPKVAFFIDSHRSFDASTRGLDSQNPKGLASLIVRGTLPAGVRALGIEAARRVKDGDAVTIIGFHQVVGVPWLVTDGKIAGRKGADLVFTGTADVGNSGGPLMLNGKVVGVVTSVAGGFGYASPSTIVLEALRGWNVPVEDRDRTGTEQSREMTGKDGAPMVLIPAGEFWMGSPDGEGDKDEHPRHRVSLDAFYLDKYEVTNTRFEQFVRDTSYRTTAEKEGKAYTLTSAGKWEEVSGAHWRKPEGGDTVFISNRAEHPVVSVSWEDAQAYCRRAAKRLPTEAEFEYATRAGSETKYWWGDESPGSRRVANVADESLKRQYSTFTIMTGYDDGAVRTAPVGSYEANPYGLHDMIGNVWEWTADWYDETYYTKSPERNPKGPSSGQYRALRGGSWGDAPGHVRSAYRTGNSPTLRIVRLGFRCAQDVQ